MAAMTTKATMARALHPHQCQRDHVPVSLMASLQNGPNQKAMAKTAFCENYLTPLAKVLAEAMLTKEGDTMEYAVSPGTPHHRGLHLMLDFGRRRARWAEAVAGVHQAAQGHRVVDLLEDYAALHPYPAPGKLP